MQSEADLSLDSIWVKPHLNKQGKLVKGHWRARPRVINVKGYFRELSFVKPYKRRRPVLAPPVELIVAGQARYYEHVVVNILRDVEPLMGY